MYMGSLKTTLVERLWRGGDSIDVLVNKWLNSHNYCKLVDIKFAINHSNMEEALIIYYEDSDS